MTCTTSREQLAMDNGRDDPLLLAHLGRCEGCREFAGEVRRQRADMAVLLQVEPSDALRSFLDEGGLSTASPKDRVR